MPFLNFIRVSYFAKASFKEAMGNTRFSITKLIKLICEKFFRWKICNLILLLMSIILVQNIFQKLARRCIIIVKSNGD